MNLRFLSVLSLAWVGVLEPALSELDARLGSPRADAKMPMPMRFTFKFDAKTPLEQFLPIPPAFAPALHPWLVQNLTQAPEVALQQALSPDEAIKAFLAKDPDKATAEEHGRRHAAIEKSTERTAHDIAKINYLNQKGTDHFHKTVLARRPDLAGLPFVMDDACRTSKEQSKLLKMEVALVQQGLFATGVKSGKSPMSPAEAEKLFWKAYPELLTSRADVLPATRVVHKPDDKSAPRIAALMQMLAPGSKELRQGLILYLADIDCDESTRALARLALFSLEEELRDLAVSHLKKRRTDVYTPLLVDGLRYPWPQVIDNAAAAIAKLERRDLLGQLVAVLDEPDPRAPVVRKGATTPSVREVVRLNHHRNCLLCHAPGNTPDTGADPFGFSENLIVAAVPNPNNSLTSPSGGYSFRSSPDILVRVDVNYLRQDFSLLQAVPNAAPWPEMQRFDFFVRTRAVSEREVEAYRLWHESRGPDYLPPNHEAALKALRALTGCDAAPTAEAWRRLLRT